MAKLRKFLPLVAVAAAALTLTGCVSDDDYYYGDNVPSKAGIYNQATIHNRHETYPGYYAPDTQTTVVRERRVYAY